MDKIIKSFTKFINLICPISILWSIILVANGLKYNYNYLILISLVFYFGFLYFILENEKYIE